MYLMQNEIKFRKEAKLTEARDERPPFRFARREISGTKKAGRLVGGNVCMREMINFGLLSSDSSSKNSKFPVPARFLCCLEFEERARPRQMRSCR
jgi:hypothetical protein